MTDSPFLRAASLARDITAQIARSHRRATDVFPTARYIAELDAARGYGGYSRVPPAIRAACTNIQRTNGLDGLELYHKLVIATLVSHFDIRRDRKLIPSSAVAQCEVEFRRILAQFDTNQAGFYLHGNDLFSKDLAICRGKLLPCGAELVDELSGVPRSVTLCGGMNQFVDALSFFASRTRGFRPFYEMHLDPRSRVEFTPEGWDRCYLRIADLLSLNTEIKGVSCSSWWFDPEVARITPKLGYLRTRPLENGARIFRVGSDESAVNNSTKFSRVRKALYERGEYKPTIYLMAWASDDLLSWARRARADGVQL